MLRFADEYDLNEILDIWNDSFKDEEKFTRWFFSHIYSCTDTIVNEQDMKIISCLQRLPFIIKGIGKASYIYGACTLPEQRGNGYMKELLQWSEKLDRKQGNSASFLIPASESLYDYYRQYGFDKVFYINEKEYHLTDNKCPYFFCEAKKTDAIKMKKLYDETLSGKNRISRTEDFFIHQIDLFRYTGGNVFLILDEERVMGYAFYSGGEKPYIQELVAKDEKCCELLCNEVMKHYKSQSINAVTLDDNIKPLGLIKLYDEEYKADYKINLMFN